jgi:hypothetical protein
MGQAKPSGGYWKRGCLEPKVKKTKDSGATRLGGSVKVPSSLKTGTRGGQGNTIPTSSIKSDYKGYTKKGSGNPAGTGKR